MDVPSQIESLEQKALNLKNNKKYLEALKKYEEVILLKRDTYGEKSETLTKSASEAAIICNILSMSFL